jgi:hypothetical protein
MAMRGGRRKWGKLRETRSVFPVCFVVLVGAWEVARGRVCGEFGQKTGANVAFLVQMRTDFVAFCGNWSEARDAARAGGAPDCPWRICYATRRQIELHIEAEAPGGTHRGRVREAGDEQEGSGAPGVGDGQQGNGRREEERVGARDEDETDGVGEGGAEESLARRADGERVGDERAVAEQRGADAGEQQPVSGGRGRKLQAGSAGRRSGLILFLGEKAKGILNSECDGVFGGRDHRLEAVLPTRGQASEVRLVCSSSTRASSWSDFC